MINMSKTSVITVKVPEELKRKMKQVKVNWSEYIRSAIQKRLEEQMVKAASTKLDEIRMRSKPVTTQELVAWIRENRER
jgi:Arc/MetJ-type ribon-helix-helix transcriptional regulator